MPALEQFLASVEGSKPAILTSIAQEGVTATSIATAKVTAALEAAAKDNPVAPFFNAQHAELANALTQEVVTAAGGEEAYIWQHVIGWAQAFIAKAKALL